MSQSSFDRRGFLQTTSASVAGASLAASALLADENVKRGDREPLAVLGGKPIRTEKFPSWPVIEQNDKDALRKVLEGGKWGRLEGGHAATFERAYAERTGAKHCTVTANGTSALFTALNALGVGPGDEVLVPPYTFVATINVVLLQHALPVFVDTDRETLQMDAKKIEAAITARTACILPAHIGGNAADMDTILAVANKHSLPVVEDACQAHLAEWRGKKLGSLGKAGCFSFQASKNLNSGEGGAILSDDGAFMDKCFTFHNNGRPRKPQKVGFFYSSGGANLRMTEFQAALLLTQMSRLEEQMKTREENAQYLTQQLQEVPGIRPAKHYEGCTRNAYHLYMFRYDKEQFGGASRGQFLKALRAEGIPCSSGYAPLNKEPFINEVLHSKGYRAIYSDDRIRDCLKNNHCPENDKLCEEAVWFTQTMFLGKRTDMDQIAAAVRKIHDNAGALAKIA